MDAEPSSDRNKFLRLYCPFHPFEVMGVIFLLGVIGIAISWVISNIPPEVIILFFP